jgi:coenzyme F420-reducing hydrogenase alpha subunit
MESLWKKRLYSKRDEYQLKVLKDSNGVKTIFLERYFYRKDENGPSEQITIHKAVLVELINSLTDCKNHLELPVVKKELEISPSVRKKIQERYLRGVGIKDLCIQTNLSAFKIEGVLKEANITIISPKESKPISYRRYYKRK